MIIKDVEFKLNDGRSAVIRSPKEKDIPGLIDYLRISASETPFIVRYPEECDKFTEEFELKFIKDMNESENEAMLICVVEGEVAGSCSISWSNKIKLKHRASIGIALISKYWNQGIGTKLFQEMIRIAEENKDIIQIELDFVEGNSRARALYEKMGFRIVGVKPNGIRLKDGTLLNEYSMIRKINR